MSTKITVEDIVVGAGLPARRDQPPGVVLGMVGMRPGGVRRIRVPPGPAEDPFVMIGKVPPNAVLVYEVTLHSILGEEHWLRLDRQKEAAGGPSHSGGPPSCPVVAVSPS